MCLSFLSVYFSYIVQIRAEKIGSAYLKLMT